VLGTLPRKPICDKRNHRSQNRCRTGFWSLDLKLYLISVAALTTVAIGAQYTRRPEIGILARTLALVVFQLFVSQSFSAMFLALSFLASVVSAASSVMIIGESGFLLAQQWVGSNKAMMIHRTEYGRITETGSGLEWSIYWSSPLSGETSDFAGPKFLEELFHENYCYVWIYDAEDHSIEKVQSTVRRLHQVAGSEFINRTALLVRNAPTGKAFMTIIKAIKQQTLETFGTYVPRERVVHENDPKDPRWIEKLKAAAASI
jgi:hypothetical protein